MLFPKNSCHGRSFLMKRGLCLWLALMLWTGTAWAAPLENGVPVELTSPSAMLLEAETGTVIFEKNADEKRQVASITKLMTLLLCFEALERGEIHPDDQVTISPAAAGQIGSQALLDSGAIYPLETLLHATIIASANDAACALAEHMAGSEAEFARLMNERAKELGMNDTFYVNATGLPDDRQYTTARDVAILSCEMCRHPEYFTHASVWLDTLTHPSGRTTDLTNTNRLVRFYDGCDGLKTGSADVSKYCLSATAQKDGLRLIAIVLGTPNSQTRFNEARAMLDYGFAGYGNILLNKKDYRKAYEVFNDAIENQVAYMKEFDLRLGRVKALINMPKADLAQLEISDPLGKAYADLNLIAAVKEWKPYGGNAAAL